MPGVNPVTKMYWYEKAIFELLQKYPHRLHCDKKVQFNRVISLIADISHYLPFYVHLHMLDLFERLIEKRPSLPINEQLPLHDLLLGCLLLAAKMEQESVHGVKSKLMEELQKRHPKQNKADIYNHYKIKFKLIEGELLAQLEWVVHFDHLTVMRLEPMFRLLDEFSLAVLVVSYFKLKINSAGDSSALEAVLKLINANYVEKANQWYQHLEINGLLHAFKTSVSIVDQWGRNLFKALVNNDPEIKLKKGTYYDMILCYFTFSHIIDDKVMKFLSLHIPEHILKGVNEVAMKLVGSSLPGFLSRSTIIKVQQGKNIYNAFFRKESADNIINDLQYMASTYISEGVFTVGNVEVEVLEEFLEKRDVLIALSDNFDARFLRLVNQVALSPVDREKSRTFLTRCGVPVRQLLPVLTTLEVLFKKCPLSPDEMNLLLSYPARFVLIVDVLIKLNAMENDVRIIKYPLLRGALYGAFQRALKNHKSTQADAILDGLTDIVFNICNHVMMKVTELQVTQPFVVEARWQPLIFSQLMNRADFLIRQLICNERRLLRMGQVANEQHSCDTLLEMIKAIDFYIERTQPVSNTYYDYIFSHPQYAHTLNRIYRHISRYSLCHLIPEPLMASLLTAEPMKTILNNEDGFNDKEVVAKCLENIFNNEEVLSRLKVGDNIKIRDLDNVKICDILNTVGERCFRFYLSYPDLAHLPTLFKRTLPPGLSDKVVNHQAGIGSACARNPV